MFWVLRSWECDTSQTKGSATGLVCEDATEAFLGRRLYWAWASRHIIGRHGEIPNIIVVLGVDGRRIQSKMAHIMIKLGFPHFAPGPFLHALLYRVTKIDLM
jgi:hypothetical protein